MTSIDVVENKIAAIRGYLKYLEGLKRYSRREVEDDLVARGAVERYLYLATQAAIDLAESVISFKGLRKPTTLREGFEILEEAEAVSAETRDKMRNMVGFRNTIAHDYAKVNYDIVYDVLQRKLPDIETYVAEVKKYLVIR